MLTLLLMSAVRTLAQPAPEFLPSAPIHPQRTAGITGRVVDESGKPVAGLALRAVISDADFGRLTAQFWTRITTKGMTTALIYHGPPPEDRIGRTLVWANATTAPDGTYAFSALTTGRYYLMDGGNLDAGRVTSPTQVEAREGATVSAPDIVVSRAVMVHGRVVSKQDGAPLSGVMLRYFDAVHPPEVAWFMSSYRNRRGTLTTDAKGNFTLEVAPGAMRFFVAGSGTFFSPNDLLLTPRQRENWPSEKDVYRQEVWGVKSQAGVYAANRWVEVEQNGQPVQELTHGQWLKAQAESQKDVSLVFRLEKLAFKNGKIPVIPVSSVLRQGNPRK